MYCPIQASLFLVHVLASQYIWSTKSMIIDYTLNAINNMAWNSALVTYTLYLGVYLTACMLKRYSIDNTLEIKNDFTKHLKELIKEFPSNLFIQMCFAHRI